MATAWRRAHLRECGPARWVVVPAFGDECGEGLRPRPLERGTDAALDDSRLEGVEAEATVGPLVRGELPQDHRKGVDLGARAVPLQEGHLGRHVARRARLARQLAAIGGELGVDLEERGGGVRGGEEGKEGGVGCVSSAFDFSSVSSTTPLIVMPDRSSTAGVSRRASESSVLISSIPPSGFLEPTSCHLRRGIHRCGLTM